MELELTRSLRISGSAGSAERVTRALLERAGIQVGGSASHDIQVHDPSFYRRVLRDGLLGLGESYMEGWWDTESLDACMERITRADLDGVIRGSVRLLAYALYAALANLQRPARAFEVGRRHYDLGNDLYRAMLDPRMIYSCAYWEGGAETLAEAQEAKLELVCRKVELSANRRLLDVGCGWGGLARFAAERHGAHVTGVTVSEAQAADAVRACAGLPVDIVLRDYREITGTFDAVVSVGMMEHVGPKNYRAYMDMMDRCLARDGVGLIHTIVANTPQDGIDPWFHRYVFPNAVLPSLSALLRAMEGRFVVEDVHNFGPDYDRTLLAWHQKLGRRWSELPPRYDRRFRRMWSFYLLTCAAGFRARRLQLCQIVVTKKRPRKPRCR
jgi:cyclopropane-fatty-acyl-phospholipid synthase